MATLVGSGVYCGESDAMGKQQSLPVAPELRVSRNKIL
jgi:hypothetical protein